MVGNRQSSGSVGVIIDNLFVPCTLLHQWRNQRWFCLNLAECGTLFASGYTSCTLIVLPYTECKHEKVLSFVFVRFRPKTDLSTLRAER